MNTWIPLWTSTVDSTLWEEPTHVRVMFLTLLMLRDPDHVVRQPFRRLVKKANLHPELARSLELARDALKVLSEPDRLSVDNQEFEGRRIVQEGADSWRVLNGPKYDEEMRYLVARVRKTRKQRERRLELRKQAAGSSSGMSAAERVQEQLERRGDSAGALRAQEMAEGALPGEYGSYGPEAQEVVRRQAQAAAVPAPPAPHPDDDIPDPDALPMPEV